jgi:hypothetical protein
MQMNDGGSRKGDRAYLGLFGRRIRTSYGIQDVSDNVDRELRVSLTGDRILKALADLGKFL